MPRPGDITGLAKCRRFRAQGDRFILEYEKFLSLCRRLNDIEGEAIAYNALGVDFQMLGGAGTYKAIQYHLKRLKVADVAGKFTAHCKPRPGLRRPRRGKSVPGAARAAWEGAGDSAPSNTDTGL
eukprot:tig00000944_g5939.t1